MDNFNIDINKLLDTADRYMKNSDWKDLALIKLCVCSAGVIAGSCIPSKSKKEVRAGAAVVFAATYAVLMTRFAKTAVAKEEEE